MALATPKRFTVDDYRRLGDVGVIAPDERTELLEGTIYLKEVCTPKQFTVDDYYRLGEAGLIGPDERTELLDGVIYPMEPIGPFHGGVGDLLVEYFWQLAKGRWIVRSQYPIGLTGTSEPQPDLALIKPAAHRYKRKHPGPSDVFLLIEISDTSLDVDRGLKRKLYGRAGIVEYCIVNLKEEAIEVYREPNSEGFSSSRVYRAGEVVHPSAFPDVSVSVAEVCRRAD